MMLVSALATAEGSSLSPLTSECVMPARQSYPEMKRLLHRATRSTAAAEEGVPQITTNTRAVLLDDGAFVFSAQTRRGSGCVRRPRRGLYV